MQHHISVCVCTFRRNEMLERLLRKLALQETEGLFACSIVVVDNDAAGPARATVARLRTELRLTIDYDIEPEQSIAAARNRTLRLAKGNYIAFIDDDEFPPSSWLLTMYKAIRTFDADGALGPVHPHFEKPPPAWLLKSGFCERPEQRTGTFLHWDQTRTGNVLLKKEVFDKHQLSFDLQYKTSGSDKEFFREAMAAGCRFVAVREAPVYEEVPPERQTLDYHLRRAVLHASNERKYRAPLLKGFARISAPLKALSALGVYTLVLPFSLFKGRHAAAVYAEKWVYHLSWLVTMLGFDLAKKRNV